MMYATLLLQLCFCLFRENKMIQKRKKLVNHGRVSEGIL